jgi:TetR/AcrR family transcriptional regulator
VAQERRPSRRERERLRQRQEILDGALELFSEKGYHNVSMHEIADRAEFAIGSLYKFFRNKEDLYRSLILEQAEKFHDAATKAIEGPGDEIDKLRRYVKAMGEVFRAGAPFIRLYLGETRGVSFSIRTGLDREIRQRHSGFLRALARVFEEGMEGGRIRRIAEPFHLAVALDSLTSAFLFLWLEDPESHPYPEDPDVILNILLKGLVGPRPRARSPRPMARDGSGSRR